jgi:FOG: Glucan-binding domain (YG repeat)
MKKLKSKLLAITVATTTIATIVPSIGTSAAWKQNQGNWYYLNDSGEMKIGWVNDNGKWYYLDNSGEMKIGWVNDNGKWYYLDNSGQMKTGWVNENGAWYYLNNSGAMKTGWINDNGTWYFSDTSGTMQTGVIKVDGHIYSLNPATGSMQVGNVTLNGKSYIFAESGEAIGKGITSSKTFNSDGQVINANNSSANNNAPNTSNTSETSTQDSSSSSNHHSNSSGGDTNSGGNSGGSANTGNNGGSGNTGDNGNGEISINNQDIFPKSQQSDLSFVGDPMPYYENGKFNIFYLDDIRDSSEIGFHPWSLLETDDFYNYTNEGIVIDHSNNNEDQDLALGTGSVIRDKNGLYHAFFDGHNDRRTGDSEVNKANLASDFGTQGSNGWNYGYGTSNKDFTLAKGYDADIKKYYKPDLDGFELHPDFVQPAVTTGAACRWTVGEDGRIDITGTYTKFTQNDSNPNWPDGVTLTIYHNDEILQQDVVPVSNMADETDNINIKMLDVKKGDNIYFIITANSNNAWDGGKLDVNINPVEQAMKLLCTLQVLILKIGLRYMKTHFLLHHNIPRMILEIHMFFIIKMIINIGC